jgi:hypothetical protein
MDNDKELKIMSATVNSIKDLLQERLDGRLDALQALTNTSMDGLPEVIQKMREEEAAKIRAIVQEQRDILSIIKSLFPQA